MYEGDFISLLNIIIYLLKNNIKPENIKKEPYTPSLFENIINISIPKNPAIIEQISKSFGKYIIKNMSKKEEKQNFFEFGFAREHSMHFTEKKIESKRI